MITLTCGHQTEVNDGLGHKIMMKGSSISHGIGIIKAINHSVVCPDCLKLYTDSGELLKSEKEAYNWLEREIW